MKKIPLNKGKFALVDDENYDHLKNKTWWISCYGYAVSGRPQVFMAREIMKAPDGMVVDHINGDKLDNRKENLRICSTSQNMMNQCENRKGSSRHKGVSFCSRTGRWRAAIKKNGKFKSLGYYDSEELAAGAYNQAAKEKFREFARLNKL